MPVAEKVGFVGEHTFMTRLCERYPSLTLAWQYLVKQFDILQEEMTAPDYPHFVNFLERLSKLIEAERKRYVADIKSDEYRYWNALLTYVTVTKGMITGDAVELTLVHVEYVTLSL